MVKHCAQLSALLAAALAAACSTAYDDSAARVTIDMRCASNADCPSGFACEAEAEHGPPTTMCQSDDPAATCPRDYETHLGHGQIFCIPRLGVRSHHDGAISSTARSPHESSSPVAARRAR